MQGDKVKFSLQFRGREMQFQEEGSKMFQVHGFYKHIRTSSVLMFSLSCSQQPFAHLDRSATCITSYLIALHLISFAILGAVITLTAMLQRLQFQMCIVSRYLCLLLVLLQVM